MIKTIRKLCMSLLWACVVFFIASGVAVAKNPHNVVYVIGDSLSDPGNFYDLTGFWPPSPPYAQRFSDGPVWTEYLEEGMNVAVDNRAYGGSFSGVQFVFGTPVENFNNVQYPSLFPPLPGVDSQIESLLNAHPEGLNPHGLYVVWAGANDFFLGLYQPENMNVVLGAAVENIAGAICKLGAFGAKHFLVGNMPDIGLSPFAKQQGESVAQYMSYVISVFNAQLDQALMNLPLECAESVETFDAYQFLNDIVASPEEFGFTNVTAPCFNPPGMCSNPDEFLFWDPVHPSTATHEIYYELIRSSFCKTGEATPGLRGEPVSLPPAAWRGVCFGTK